ncbi:MAG: tetratricopeptide repeat protein [Nitrospirota bacterium]
MVFRLKLYARYLELLSLCAIVLLYSMVTYQRNFIWKNSFILWSDAIKKSPEKARPYNNLGRAYLSNKAFLQAIPYLREALRFNPYFSYAHYNLGIAYQGTGLYDDALNEYKKALYGTPQPYFANVHNNMGVCYFKKGLTDMAIEEFKQALKIDPDFSDARFNLDVVYKAQGR